MGQSAQEGHLFFVHKIHRENLPDERSGENARAPTVDIVENWKLSRDISRDRCPQRSVREAANMMVLCTGAGAPKASPEGKLASEARLMRATGGNLTGRTSIRPNTMSRLHASPHPPQCAHWGTFPRGKA